MGYWASDPFGNSFAGGVRHADEADEYIWGDAPADIVDNALEGIIRVFQEDVGRSPRRSELLSGFLFSVPVKDDVTDDGAVAVVVNRDAVLRLAQAWRNGVSDEVIVAAVRDVFHGIDGELTTLQKIR